MDFSQYPITLLLIAANVIFTLIGFSNAKMLNRFIMWPIVVKEKNQWDRFITSGFLHADFMHLFFNMFTLYFFGRNMELIFNVALPLGNMWYLLIYFAGLIVADIPSYLKNINNPNYRSLGASGAVSAVVFAAVVFDPWSQLQLYGFISMSALIFAFLYVGYCIYASKRGVGNVNHDAHLWGSLFGLAATLLLMAVLRPDIFPFIIEDLKNPSLFGRRELGETLKQLLYR